MQQNARLSVQKEQQLRVNLRTSWREEGRPAPSPTIYQTPRSQKLNVPPLLMLYTPS